MVGIREAQLRQQREAQAEAKAKRKLATVKPAPKPVATAKPDVTKVHVTKVRHRMGRPCLGDKPMTDAERVRRHRARKRARAMAQAR